MLLTLLAIKCYALEGNIFSYTRIHKETWISSDHSTENQIDHICIAKTLRSSLHDVLVFKGADTDLDHHLLVREMKLKLRKYIHSCYHGNQCKIGNFISRYSKSQ